MHAHSQAHERDRLGRPSRRPAGESFSRLQFLLKRYKVISRETVIEFIRNLPEEMSLPEIAREIELLVGIQSALEQAKHHEGIPAKDALKFVDAWASK